MFRSRTFIPRALLTVFVTYLLVFGATFEGILNSQLRLQGMVALGVGFAVWLFARLRKREVRWHRTALDAAMLLWVVAFALSLLTNLEDARRILMGLWFMAAYIGAWYVLNDALANRLISRDMLVDAMLFAGLIVVMLGYLQIQTWARQILPLILAGDAPFSLPRPVSTLGNPNTLAAALVILLPFPIGRAVGATNALQRLVMVLYSLIIIVLLISTYSRGGWLGTGASLIFLILWLLAERNRLSITYWRGWWGRQRSVVRVGLLMTLAFVLVMAIVGGVLFLGSFSIGGRTLDLRTYLFDIALDMFAQKPLTGHGLFTFGAGLARLYSVPPTQPHSHAHNLPLQVAAELGIVGLSALALTVWQLFRAIRANLGRAGVIQKSGERLTIAIAAAAVFGFCVHHLPDLPAMNPAVMVMLLVALAGATIPAQPQPFSRSSGRAMTALAVVGGMVLLITGLWSSLIYRQYTDAVSYGIRTGDYVGAAAQLQPVIAADPNMAVYQQQRGFLLGLAAAEGDTSVLPEAIVAFEQYTVLAPYYSLGWANLAALYAQAGDYAQAVEHMAHAVAIAPNEPVYTERLDDYQAALASGQLDAPDISIPISLDRDRVYLPDINYIQWLRLSIERQFLPQVGYTYGTNSP